MRHPHLKYDMLFETGGVAVGVRYTGNWVHSTPEMPPSFFLLHQDICWDGAGHVTVALLIDAIKDNKPSSIYHIIYGGSAHPLLGLEGKKHGYVIRSLERYLIRVVWSFIKENRFYEIWEETKRLF